jgi:hypothetical protein
VIKFRWRPRRSKKRPYNGVFDCLRVCERIAVRHHEINDEIIALCDNPSEESMVSARKLIARSGALVARMKRVKDIQDGWKA